MERRTCLISGRTSVKENQWACISRDTEKEVKEEFLSIETRLIGTHSLDVSTMSLSFAYFTALTVQSALIDVYPFICRLFR